jgi:hypothetical protein
MIRKGLFMPMKHAFAFIPIFVLSTSLAVHAQGVGDKLSQDITGKSFTLAIDIAGTTCMMETPLGAADLRFVDTEIDESSDPRFYMRDAGLKYRACDTPVGTVNDLQGTYIAQSAISQMFAKGSVAIVKSVVSKSDRIEIQLVPDKVFLHDSDTMKIKLMLGKGYGSHTLEQIEAVLNRALVFPPLASTKQQQGAAAVVPAPDASFAPVAPPPPPDGAPSSTPKTVALGQAKDQVIAILGQPQKVASVGTKEIDFYPDMKVIFVNGAVTDIQ